MACPNRYYTVRITQICANAGSAQTMCKLCVNSFQFVSMCTRLELFVNYYATVVR